MSGDQMVLVLPLLFVGGCKSAPPDPTFDADARLVTSWATARAEAPDGVALKIVATHIDSAARVHYGDDGSLALVMLSASNLGHTLSPGWRGGCANLWQIVGPVATERPNDPALHSVAEWRTGDCSARGARSRPPRCSFAQIWQRAIRDGAPRDAIAEIEALTLDEYNTPSWIFTIRGDHPYRLRYRDDC